MFKTWFGKFDKKIFYTLAVLSVTAAALLFAATYNTADAQVKGDDGPAQQSPTAIFPANAGTLGAIPDNLPGTPRDVTFTVSGITGAPTNVEVSHTYLPIHSWAGDINVTLIAPNATSFVIYGRTGQTGASAGDSSDLSGPYNFNDIAAGTNWWTAANTAGAAAVIPPGDYRTTQTGPQPVITTSPVTNLTAAFAGVANANGLWTLRFTDNAAGDTGSVSAATLTITSAVTPVQNYVDFDGNGRTDFSVVRNTGGGMSGQITWFTQYNGVAGSQIDAWGIATDFFVPGNYDADNKTDIAVWRPGAAGVAAYYILQSQTSTLRAELFGQSGDDPTMIGDYNNDGRDDLAVYRSGAAPGDKSFWYWRQAVAGPVFVVDWGQNGDFPVPGDFDGDGSSDFVIQRNAGGGQARFWIRSATGVISSTIFGTPTDTVVPGDYDGDGKTDIAVVRSGGGQIQWWVLSSLNGSTTLTTFGNVATDFMAQGDYDGDGKTDIAVWRPDINPTQNFFHVLGSTAGYSTFEWGQNGDYPVANYNTH
jgi:hypothetical protein